MVAQKENITLRYVHQDSLNSTSVMSTSTGTLDSSITFFPFGGTRTGSVSSDKKFTGQRLDGTGLYYYGARYYDAGIGRFISADTVVQSPANPQTLNRYSYCLNNPLKYIDPSGYDVVIPLPQWVIDYVEAGIPIDPALMQDYFNLVDAWYLLCEVAPDITYVMENTDKEITIGYGDADGSGAITDPDYPSWNAKPDENGNYIPSSFKIEINSDKVNDIITMTGVLAHESFHVLADLMGCTYKAYSNGNYMWASDSWLEETFAYSYQAQVLNALGVDGTGYDYNSTMVRNFGDLNPGLSYEELYASAYNSWVAVQYPTMIRYPTERSIGALLNTYYICFPGQTSYYLR